MGMPYVLIYMRGGGGAGDAKLMMGLGVWAGFDLSIYLLIAVMITGLIYALTLSTIKGEFKVLIYGVLLEIYQLATLKRSKATIPPSPTAPVSADEVPASSSSALVYAPVVACGVLIGGVVWFLA